MSQVTISTIIAMLVFLAQSCLVLVGGGLVLQLTLLQQLLLYASGKEVCLLVGEIWFVGWLVSLWIAFAL